MGKTIAICIQKGGEGKSTTTICLSAYLALNGYKTLVIDFEPQGNSSKVLRGVEEDSVVSLYDVLIDKCTLNDIIMPTQIDGLDLIPANEGLVRAEKLLLVDEDGEYKLRDLIDKSDIRDKYDYIIIDTPPSLGLSTSNSLIASDYVIVPFQCADYSIDGLQKLERTIDKIRERTHVDIRILGLFINKYLSNRTYVKIYEEQVQEKYRGLLFRTKVRQISAIEEAASSKKPVFFYDPRSLGAMDFDALCREILERLKAVDSKSIAQGVLS